MSDEIEKRTDGWYWNGYGPCVTRSEAIGLSLAETEDWS